MGMGGGNGGWGWVWGGDEALILQFAESRDLPLVRIIDD